MSADSICFAAVPFPSESFARERWKLMQAMVFGETVTQDNRVVGRHYWHVM